MFWRMGNSCQFASGPKGLAADASVTRFGEDVIRQGVADYRTDRTCLSRPRVTLHHRRWIMPSAVEYLQKAEASSVRRTRMA
jgi:hypothetical protein